MMNSRNGSRKGPEEQAEKSTRHHDICNFFPMKHEYELSVLYLTDVKPFYGEGLGLEKVPNPGGRVSFVWRYFYGSSSFIVGFYICAS